ncbi:uncharacterized protein ARMOST_18867 [Armillaria ostoyae]|uniref:Uncharacterized protein n=1 Tax=Armillaria ostoyae TaxID=47428 RepID=A0A284S313_ARMOS|nr:uncharacterized protein ARMOST_18867 [Armillaria ostoyae]
MTVRVILTKKMDMRYTIWIWYMPDAVPPTIALSGLDRRMRCWQTHFALHDREIRRNDALKWDLATGTSGDLRTRIRFRWIDALLVQDLRKASLGKVARQSIKLNLASDVASAVAV